MIMLSLIVLFIFGVNEGQGTSLDCNLKGVCLVSFLSPYCALKTNVYSPHFQGEVISEQVTLDINYCWFLCQSAETCSWLSYDSASQNCILLSTCPEINELDNYTSSQLECKYPHYSKCFNKSFIFGIIHLFKGMPFSSFLRNSIDNYKRNRTDD